MKRFLVVLTATGGLALAVVSGSWAYGGGADHEMWQVGISQNCNDPDLCGSELGGFWGWAEFDRSADGRQTWGDAELTGCGHTIGGGGPGSAGAGHESLEISSWRLAPGTGGPSDFYVTGTGTVFLPNGVKLPITFTDEDTGVPSAPGHYDTTYFLGMSAPGVAFETQVAYRPAR